MSDRAIISAVQKMTGTFREDKVSMLLGTVVSIQGNTCTCIIDDELELPNCHLQSTVCDGFLLIPAVGSSVVILNSKKNDPIVVSFGDLDHVYLQVGESSIEVAKSGEITLNDGNLGGLVKVADIVAKLNNLENKVNSIISNYNSHLHSNGNGGSPTGTPLAPITGTLNPTQQADIENLKVKQ